MIARSIDRCAINGSIDGAAQSMDRANPLIARNNIMYVLYCCTNLLMRSVASAILKELSPFELFHVAFLLYFFMYILLLLLSFYLHELCKSTYSVLSVGEQQWRLDF